MNCTRTLLIIAGVCWPAAAHASDEYLQYLYETYDWQALDCLVCHTTPEGTKETATTPFAMQLKTEYGVEGKDQPSLERALQQMEDEGLASDVDGDGYGNIEELRANTDPNDYYDPPIEEPPDTSTSTSSGGTGAGGSGTGGTEAGGTSAGGADDDDQGDDGGPSPIAGASTTGRIRPPKPPARELPPTFDTGCSTSTPAAPSRTPWFPALLLGGLVFARRARKLRTR